MDVHDSPPPLQASWCLSRSFSQCSLRCKSLNGSFFLCKYASEPRNLEIWLSLQVWDFDTRLATLRTPKLGNLASCFSSLSDCSGGGQHPGAAAAAPGHAGPRGKAGRVGRPEAVWFFDMAVHNQWYHVGVGAPPILVYFIGDWDVHWGYGLLTHGHISPVSAGVSGPCTIPLLCPMGRLGFAAPMNVGYNLPWQTSPTLFF